MKVDNTVLKPRHETHGVLVGDVKVGGGTPVVVQSMTITDTSDIEATTKQIIDLAEAGWVEVDGDWRNGWYGQEDKPAEVAKQHVPEGHDFVFVVGSVGQFELSFGLWIRPQ